MSIRTFISLFIGAVLLMFLVLSGFFIATSGLLSQRVEQVRLAGDSIHLGEQLKSSLLTHNRDAFLYAIQNAPERLSSRREHSSQIDGLLKQMDRIVGNEEEASVLDAVRAEMYEYLEERRRLEQGGLTPQEQYNDISGFVDHALALIDLYIDTNRIQMEDLAAAIDRENAHLRSLSILLALAGAVLLLALFVAVIRQVSQPLSALANLLSRYGSGERALRAQKTGLREIRDIGGHFNVLADRLEEGRRQQLGFIASIAHDLRNPLQAIALSMEVLRMKAGREASDLVEGLSRQVRYLDTLVGDLLDASRIEAGRLLLAPEILDLGTFLRQAVNLAQGATDRHTFRLRLPPEPLLACVDPRLLSQVLNNLLSNAVKYSPDGGEIHVDAARQEAELLIAVRDEGIGIEPEERDKLFTPFYRAQKTRGTLPGIGLGLSSSRRIVEAHGGRFELDSVPGEGSTFRILLPAPPHDGLEGGSDL